MQFKELHPRRFFLETWASIDAEANLYRREHAGRLGKDALITALVFSLVAISLVFQEYLGNRRAFADLVQFIDNTQNANLHPFLYKSVAWLRPTGQTLLTSLTANGYYELALLCYWAAWRIVGFLAFPALAILFCRPLRRREFGLTFKSMGNHVGIYAILFLPVFIAVIAVSFTNDFSSYYPFYSNAHRSLFDFAFWEAFYVMQFFALEFFFRGFMLQPLRQYMGSSAIFAMMIPYVMIHIGKPMLECFAAIIAGVVLGTLALRTRSIWLGFFIHVSVALSMDLAAMWQVHFRG